METKEVILTIVEDTCVYLNDYRIQGRKPYVSEFKPQKHINVKVKNILDSLDIEDIEEYMLKK